MENILKVSKILVFTLPFILYISLISCNGTEIKQKKKAYDFELRSFTGELISLKKTRGKIVLLNFWATYCSACVREMSSMERLYQKMKGKNFEIISISMDSKKEQMKVQKFVEAFKLSFPVMMDPDGEVIRKYKVGRIPVSYIIDKKGFIIEEVVGPREWDEDYFRLLENLSQ